MANMPGYQSSLGSKLVNRLEGIAGAVLLIVLVTQFGQFGSLAAVGGFMAVMAAQRSFFACLVGGLGVATLCLLLMPIDLDLALMIPAVTVTSRFRG